MDASSLMDADLNLATGTIMEEAETMLFFLDKVWQKFTKIYTNASGRDEIYENLLLSHVDIEQYITLFNILTYDILKNSKTICGIIDNPRIKINITVQE